MIKKKNKILPREKTRAVYVGGVQIGHQNDIIIQTMLTEKPKFWKKCVKKINELAKIGCQIVRISCYSNEDAKMINNIVKNTTIPIVVDIHYSYGLVKPAVLAGASKIRINPGNINKRNIIEIIEICKKHKVPIRIGINSGSLEPDLLLKYGPTWKAMIESAKRSVAIFEDNDFYDIVLSLKNSDPYECITAYKKASKLFKYPLHIGITEAGSLERSLIKSSCALGELIKKGIGDTIRISISDDPIHEIRAAKELLRYYKIRKNIPNLISCPTCGRLNYDMIPIVKKLEYFLDEINAKITIAVMGCTVNGPGEAKRANIAIHGDWNDVHLYIDEKFKKTIPTKEILDELKKEILLYIKKNSLK